MICLYLHEYSLGGPTLLRQDTNLRPAIYIMTSDVVINMEQRRKNFGPTVMCHECENVTEIVTGTHLLVCRVKITLHKMNPMLINVPGPSTFVTQHLLSKCQILAMRQHFCEG